MGEDAADSQRWELRQPRGQLGDIFSREAEAVHAAIYLDMYRVVAEPMRLGGTRQPLQKSKAIHLGLEALLEEGIGRA